MNIRIGNTWLGELEEPTETEFEQFMCLEYGLRAGFIILRRYIRRFKRDTIGKILETWAPSSGNNTLEYIAAVCDRMKITSDTPVDYRDRETMCALVQAMAYVEVGEVIPLQKIIDAYNIA